MMHDVLCMNGHYFFEGFIEVNCKHRRGTWFYLKIAKIFAIGFLFKGKNETKEKVFNKS